MIKIHPIEAFTDNYIWCIATEGRAVIVDPGEAQPVKDYLAQHDLILDTLLITHHHADHVGGVPELVSHYDDVTVIGAAQRIPAVTHVVEGGDRVTVPCLNAHFDVISVPGHTRDHLAYFNAQLGLFCGDTLFSGGCGRLFEGTPEQMRRSLGKLTALPDNTSVYCAHEYTLANLAFAETVEPDNAALTEYQRRAEHMREQQRPTLPSSIGHEQAINPFLRLHSHTLRQSLEQRAGHALQDDDTRFAILRDWKDHF